MTQELERGDSGVRSFVSVQSGLCMYPIYAFGSEEQKQKYLPKMALGEILGCFGLTEPDAGSNPGAMRTRAKKDGDSYVLNGEKMWITSGSIADIAIIWAKVDRRRRAHPRLHRPHRHPRLQGRRRPRQVVAARLRHLQPIAARRPYPCRLPPARLKGTRLAPQLPQPGALRHRLGSHRRSHGLLRLLAAIRSIPQAVPRHAYRRTSAGTTETSLDD